MVQKEKPSQSQCLDDPQLLFQARCGALPDLGRPMPIPLRKAHAAQRGQLAHRLCVLRAGIAVAEIRAQVELQPFAHPGCLRHRFRILREARGHGLGRSQHVAEVAAALRLRAVERRVQPHRYERVLQGRAGARMSMNVSGCHARHLERARERLQPSVARAIVAQIWPLKLDPQALGAERFAQPPQRGFVMDTVQRAARETHQPLAVLEERLE